MHLIVAEVDVTLLADRFLLRGDDEAIDLSTGEAVRLFVGTQGAPHEQARWASRCARLAALRHPALARLVDYGATGDTRRFEAWRGVSHVFHECASRDAERAQAACLAAAGLAVGPAAALLRDRGRAVVVPGDAAGYDCDRSGAALPVKSGVPALQLIPRASARVVGELLQQQPIGLARPLSLWGAAGAGVPTALLEIARTARLHGVVPICARMATPEVCVRLKRRSLLVIARDEPSAAWVLWLELSMASRRQHLLLYAGAEDLKGTLPLPLERFSADALAGAVIPGSADPHEARRIRHAAAASNGLPGLFAQRLWRAAEPPALRLVSVSRVAEPGVDYQAHGGAAPAAAGVAVGPVLPELEDHRAPFATAERHLRQAIGAHGRRHEWQGAAERSLALGTMLLARGRGHDAAVVIDWARQYARRAADVALLLRAAMLAAEHALEQQQLEEAGAILCTARSTAHASGDADGALAAALASARVLVWRGRFDDAAAMLSPWADEALSPPQAVACAALRSRIAIGQSHLADAVALAARALAAASAQPAEARLEAWEAMALAHLAVDDRVAVARDVEEALAQARTAHAPRAALSVRLIGAEAERRAGQKRRAARLVARLARRGASHVPPLLATRVQLLASLLKKDTTDVVERLSTHSGLGGLTLYAPRPAPAPPHAPIVSGVLEILRCCQSADEDARIAQQVCEMIRQRLRVTTCAAFIEERGQLTLLSHAGSRVDAGEAERVYRLAEAVGPRPSVPAGSYGGAAVRWGGEPIGVLQVYWPPCEGETLPDWATLITAAAIAVAPMLAAERLRRLRPPAAASELLGTSAAMVQVRAAVERAAPAPFAVLIEGESGSGKELVARALHRRSPRKDRGCCAVNCAALPDDLLESELFGHARGAFTGAMAERVGVFEEAHGGTLFLDEVGELSARAQAKLLRAIQEGEIRRVGENTPRRIDVRIVAATNRNLRAEADAGRFRVDLLYRLDVIRIVLPPLRDRSEDVALLAEHFWRDATARVNSRATLGVATLAALARYHWPGNVRELQNVLAALVVKVPARGVVGPSALPAQFHMIADTRDDRLEAARRRFEAGFVRQALARAGGQKARAAEELGLTRQGLAKLLVRLGLEPSLARSRKECV